MTRLFYVMLAVVAVSLLAAPAWSAVPYPPNCLKHWYSTIDDSAIALCPQGDWSWVDVTIKDQFNTPMAGVTVQVLFDDVAVVLWPNAQGVTDINGHVAIHPKGSVNWAGPIAKWVKIRVMCLAVTIETDYRYVLSPDYNASGAVTGGDFGFFGDDWLRIMLDCHSNFVRSNPQVQSGDFSFLGAHWLHHN